MRNPLRPTKCVLCFCVAAFAASVQPGAAQDTPPAIKVEVRQVLVPVFVTDRKGHHVDGLQASDFHVFEEGVEQQIVSFGTELAPSPFPLSAPPRPAGPSNPPASRQAAESTSSPILRTYLIVVDSLYMSSESAPRVCKSLQKLFEQEEISNSRYALVALGRDLRILRSVTGDPAEILAIAQDKNLTRNLIESDGVSAAEQEAQLKWMLEKHCGHCPCDDPLQVADQRFGASRGCTVELDRIESWTAAAALERTALTRTFLRKLRDAVAQLARQPGKRNLILVSDGFEMRGGAELYSLIAIYTSRPSFVQKNPGDYLGTELEEVARTATSGNVVVYSVDARGLPAPTLGVFDATSDGRRFVRNAGPTTMEYISHRSVLETGREDAMAHLADVTGGIFFHGNSNLTRGMKRAFADGREYYVLAYVPTNRAEDGEFRRIHVEVNKKKLTVRAKEGYWAPGPTTSPALDPSSR